MTAPAPSPVKALPGPAPYLGGKRLLAKHIIPIILIRSVFTYGIWSKSKVY
jgi:hypothetical protein